MRDKAKELYETGFGTLKKIADELGISENTVKSWKTRYKWVKPKKIVAPEVKKLQLKKKKEVAKALIEEGYTIREVANKTELHPSTLKRMSSKEKLQQSQLENLKEFRELHQERIKKNKLQRLETNEEALESIQYEISNWRENGKISKSAMEKLVMNEELEQLIFESDRIERLEKLELERIKSKDDDESSSKTMEAIDKLSKKLESDFNEG